MASKAARLAQLKKTLRSADTRVLLLEAPDWSAPPDLPLGFTAVNGVLWLNDNGTTVGVHVIGIADLRAPSRAEAEAECQRLLTERKAKAPGSKVEPEAVGPLREPSATEPGNRTR